MTIALLADMGRGFDRDHDGIHFLGILFWALLLAAVVAAIVWAVRGRRTPPASGPATTSITSASSPTANAEAILAERLARGEVAPDDYRVLLATLRGEAAPVAPGDPDPA